MNIHEHQAKALLRRFGVPTPTGKVAGSAAEAPDVIAGLAKGRLVVKAQIHAGGRGKAGGVILAKDAAEAAEAAKKLIGATLVTPQTGPGGKVVNSVLIEEVAPIAKEFYAGLTLDRASRRMCLMVSREGGMDIEEVAEKHPDAICKVFIDPAFGLQGFEARRLAASLGVTGKTMLSAASVFLKLYNACVHLDASLVEINPLALTEAGDIVALDAKMSFDDSALFRHKDITELEDVTEVDPREHKAAVLGMKFIGLDGSVAMMANGAGLAMTTMDIVRQLGAYPANFLDLSGGASEEMVAEGVNLVLGDPKVKAIFINIFGGILRCDILARGLLQGLGGKASPVPIVMRMAGTNVEEGRKIMAGSGLDIDVVTTLSEAIPRLAAIVRQQQ